MQKHKYIFLLAITAFSLGQMPAVAGEAAETFTAKCAMCHSPDGSGSSAMGQKMKVRDLRSPEVQKQADDALTSIIANGKAPMPAYGKTLAPADIHKLVMYVRGIAAKS